MDERGDAQLSALTRRRPIALVVIVAASGRHGVSRDKLAGLLWPDAGPAAARHSLTQALYAARRAFRVDDLFLTDGTIRLNGARVWTDVGAFVNALGEGATETAASLYTGPFLDGFQIGGHSDFDAWSSDRRHSFEDEALDCFEKLAELSEQSGDLGTALNWRKRAMAIGGVDTPKTTRLIALLMRMGRRAEAIQRVEQHEAKLRSLGFPADPTFVGLAETVRGSSLDSGRGVGRTAGRGSANASAAPTQRRRVIVVAASVVLTILTAAGLVAHRTKADATPAVSQSLVVAPFDASGVSRPMGYMGVAMAELLSPRLALDSLVRPIDAGSVVGRWRARFSDGTSGTRDSLIALGREMGANRIVVGTVSGARARVFVEATMLSLPRAVPIAFASVEGPADSLTVLAGSLAAKLLIAEVGEDERLATRWRGSFGALRRLVAGRLADRRGDYLTAAREYEAALVADSTLATAALRLAVAADRLGNADLEADAVSRAWAYRKTLDEAANAKLLAFAGSEYPRPSSTEAQWRAWTALASRDARGSNGWLHLAARLFHEGDRLGRAGAADRAEAAAHRALAMDAENRATVSLLDAIDARRRGPDSYARPVGSTMTAIRASAMSGLWMGGDVRATRRAVEMLSDRAGTIDEALDAMLARHSLTVNQGNTADALDATRRLHALRPESHAYLRLRVLDALYGNGDNGAGRDAAQELATTVDLAGDGFPLEGRRRAADGCVVAQWRLAHGDTAGVPRIITFLRRRETPATSQPVSAAPAVCAELLDAAIAVTRGAPDAMRQLARLDSLSLTTAVAGDAATYEHILIARLYRRLGHPHRALAAIRRRSYMLGWPRYLTTTLREERALAAEAGDVAGVMDAERALGALTSSSEP